MIRFSYTLLLASLIILCLGSNISARDWSLGKDTVSVWQTGADTIVVGGQKRAFSYLNKVSITNGGAQGLRLDSFFLERVQASFQTGVMEFRVYDSAKSVGLSQGVASTKYRLQWYCPTIGACTRSRPAAPNMEPDTVRLPTQPMAIYDVIMFSAPITAKRSASSATMDTTRFRAIFAADSQRGRDTVMLVGTPDYTTSISYQRPEGFTSPLPGSNQFDLRGRRLEKIPERGKHPWLPTVGPQE